MKKTGYLILFILCTAGSGLQGSSGSELKIYLPRRAQIEGDVVHLGQVGIVQGQPALAARAEKAGLGRFSLPGQTIEVDRVTILSCLAGLGIDTDKVQLSGAETIQVYRDEPRIGGAAIADAARAYLEEQLKPLGLVTAEAMRIPADFIGRSGTPSELKMFLQPARIKGRRSVLAVLHSEDQTKRIQVDFQVRFQARRAIAKTAIEAGQKIRADQFRMEPFDSPEPQQADWKDPAGLVSRVPIAAGAEIRQDLLGEPVPPVVIQKRQKVILKIEQGLLLITAAGEAMDEGAAGDVIRVKRGFRPDERMIVGTIQPDGTVKPLF